MSSLLLRVVKRRASLELADPVEVCAVEFRTKDGEFDLRVSAYEIDDQQTLIVRTHAEHSANVPLNPPCGGPSLHFGGVGAVVETQTSQFVFIRGAHREICFDDKSDLVRGVATVLAEKAARRRHASKEEVRGYVRDRLQGQDAEWSDFCATNTAWKIWGEPKRP
jgi:hypothetical protein